MWHSFIYLSSDILKYQLKIVLYSRSLFGKIGLVVSSPVMLLDETLLVFNYLLLGMDTL